MNTLQLAKNIETEIIQIRRDLHQIPEIGFELLKTMNYIANYLEQHNIPYKKVLNGSGIVAEIQGSTSGKCIAIRADSDALPIKENTGLSFASQNQNMHACGHDAHTAIALGCSRVLNENKEAFEGTVKILFQPAEEGPGGALPMINAGVLENPKVDTIIGLHVGSLFNELPEGSIGVKSGPLMASVDVFRIIIKGKGSHAAQPHKAIDPIVTASEVVLALQKIVAREVDPLQSAVLSIGVIRGGVAQNIIPDEVYLEGTVRTLNENVRQYIAKRINDIVNYITQANNCRANINYDFMYPVVVNHPEITNLVEKSAIEVLGDEAVKRIEQPLLVSEDFAYFLQKVKGSFFILSNPKQINGIRYPHHSDKFDIDEDELYKGVAVFLQTTINFLNQFNAQ